MARFRVLLLVVFIIALPWAAGAQAFSKDDPVGAEQEFVTTKAEGWVSDRTVYKIVAKEASADRTVLSLSQTAQTRVSGDSSFTAIETDLKLYYTAHSITTPKDNLSAASALVDDLLKDNGLKVDISFSGDDPSIPLYPKAGEKLPDILVDIVMRVEGIKAKVQIKETDRRVGTRERITVPAGTFDAYLVEGNTTLKASILLMSQTEKEHVKSWLVPGMGEIKSMSYDKKGKLESITEMVRYNK